MKKKNLPFFNSVKITDFAAEGKAIARIPMLADNQGHTTDIVCFVSGCVPGDIVDLQVTRKKHSFMEARVERFVQYSECRTTPVCPHFGTCGGCKWQMLPYPAQLQYKQQQVLDALTRIGKVQLPEITPIIGSQSIYEYRNKLEFSAADRKWLSWDEINAAGGLEHTDNAYGLGFHMPGAFDKVLDITDCHLMPPYNNDIRNFIRTYAQKHNISFYNEHTPHGVLRTIMLRANNQDELMLVVSFGEEDVPFDLLEAIHQSFPQIVSLQYVVNTKFNDTIGDLDVRVYFGADHLVETMGDLHFKVGPKSFYQTNTNQAYELYKVAAQFALQDIDSSPLIYDLYTGTGTIANFVARQARQVIGIEYVPEAIEDAKYNSTINGIGNTLFYAGDMKDILNRTFIEHHGRPDVIITDPPRAGMHEDVVNTILFAQPKVIVYVSCNPATQARDLALLDACYRVTNVQPVDMFPHTHHVENVVRLCHR